MSPLTVAAIGAGLRFNVFVDVISTLPEAFRLVAVADINTDALDSAQRSYPWLDVTTDYHQLLRDPSIDALFVLTPDFTHADIGCQALKAGKHVYIDKPMATSIADADRLIETERSSQGRLYIGHNMRFMPLVETMKSVIDRGLIGSPQTFWIRHFIGRGGDYFFKDWHCESDKSGGLLIHKASHDLDAMAYILGTSFSAVQAVGGNLVYHRATMRAPHTPAGPVVNDTAHWPPLSQVNLNPAMDVEDVSLVNIACTNGIIGSYMQCHFSPDYWRNYCIIGTEGRVENFGDTSENGVVKVWNTRRPGYDPEPDIAIPIDRDVDQATGHDGADRRILEDFYTCVRGIAEPRTSLADARQVIAVGEIAREDILSGHALRQLPAHNDPSHE